MTERSTYIVRRARVTILIPFLTSTSGTTAKINVSRRQAGMQCEVREQNDKNEQCKTGAYPTALRGDLDIEIGKVKSKAVAKVRQHSAT